MTTIFLILKEIAAADKILYGLDYNGAVWKLKLGKKNKPSVWVRVTSMWEK